MYSCSVLMDSRDKADPPRIVSINPWASLRAWLDDDGETVYFHLGPTGEDAVFGSLWVRNNGPAPEIGRAVEPASGERGLQPRRHTRHPEGRPLERGQVLEVLWFEEGDGAALFIDGELEAVLPPWGGVGEFRGYAVGARGRGPYAWELVLPNPLGARVARARAHWDALNHGGLWPHLQAADRAHLEARIGPFEAAWAVTPPEEPPRAVASFRTGWEHAPLVFSTIGMAAQPMPRIEAEREDFLPRRRVQVLLASARPGDWIPRLLGEMARYPWRELTWIGDGHVIAAPGIDTDAAPGRFPAVLLLADPPPTAGRAAPGLAGQRDRAGDPINHLWALPITAGEHALTEREGSQVLVDRLGAAGLGWVHDAGRADVA